METAKVDIRKLQLLNDRINQCIDALNQVRLSVHGLTSAQGLSHTSGPFAGALGFTGAPFGGGYGGFPQTPFGQGGGINPSFGMGQGPGINPVFGYGQGLQGQGQGFPGQGFPGLSHTGGLPGINPYLSAGGVGAEGLGLENALRPMWADPFLAARITQTFPYAQFPAPPVVTIY
jgi:hypothetical protein